MRAQRFAIGPTKGGDAAIPVARLRLHLVRPDRHGNREHLDFAPTRKALRATPTLTLTAGVSDHVWFLEEIAGPFDGGLLFRLWQVYRIRHDL